MLALTLLVSRETLGSLYGSPIELLRAFAVLPNFCYDLYAIEQGPIK